MSYRHTRRHKTPRHKTPPQNKNPQNPINLQQHQYRQHTYSQYHIRQYSPIRPYTHYTLYTCHIRISPAYSHIPPISPIRTCVIRTMPTGSLYVPGSTLYPSCSPVPLHGSPSATPGPSPFYDNCHRFTTRPLANSRRVAPVWLPLSVTQHTRAEGRVGQLCQLVELYQLYQLA